MFMNVFELLKSGQKEQEEMDKWWRGGAKCSHGENTWTLSYYIFAIDLVIHTRGKAQGWGHCKRKKGMCDVGVNCKTTFGNILNQGALPNVKTWSNFSTHKEYPKSSKADHL
jgi:hypothetical protein